MTILSLNARSDSVLSWQFISYIQLCYCFVLDINNIFL